MKALTLNVLILLFCTTGPHYVLAHPAEALSTDSLHTALIGAEGPGKIDALYALFKTFVYTNLDSAFHYADRALREALAQQDSLAMARMYRARGSVQMYQGDLELAISDMEAGLALAQLYPSNGKDIAFFLLNDLGIAYTKRGKLDRAMEYHFQYLAEAESREDQRSASISLNNIGAVYDQLDDYKSAMKYYKRARAVKQAIGDKWEAKKLSINIGRCHSMAGNHSQARIVLQRVLADCVGGQCTPDILAGARIMLGSAYLNQGEYGQAKKELNKGLAVARYAGLADYRCMALRRLAELALQQKRAAAAIKLLDQAKQVGLPTNLQLEYMRLYAMAHSALGNYKISDLYWKDYNNNHEKVLSGNIVEKIAQAQAAYEERANQQQLVQQKKLVNLKHQALEASGTKVILVSTATGIVLVVLIVVGVMYYQKRVDNLDITKQKNQLEKRKTTLERKVRARTKELDESGNLLNKVNRELQHLMHKISHDVQGPVATIQGMCALAISEVKSTSAREYFKMTGDTANVLDSIITRLQSTIEINNAEINMQQINLLDVTHNAWASVAESRRLNGKEKIPKDFEIEYSISKKIYVYSSYAMVRTILENLLDNTVKFRNLSNRTPSFAKITAKEKTNHIEIKAIDNGIGVPEHLREAVFELFVRATARRQNTGGMGLYLADMAARRIGATMKLGVSKGGYTELLLKIPKNFVPQKQQLDKDGNKIATWIPEGEL